MPSHLLHHLTVMAELHAQGRYDRVTDDLFRLTGRPPTSMYEFAKLNAAAFSRSEASAAT